MYVAKHIFNLGPHQRARPGRAVGGLSRLSVFSAVLPTGERFRDKHAGDLLADRVVDATPAGWLHAGATDRRGRVAVVKEEDTLGFCLRSVANVMVIGILGAKGLLLLSPAQHWAGIPGAQGPK